MATETLREGLILEPGGYYYNRFQFIPTLVVEKDHIDRAVAIMDTVLTPRGEEIRLRLASCRAPCRA